MYGALLQFAKNDAAFIASSGGFQVDATLTTPDGTTSIAVTGLPTGTWMQFDDTERGKVTNSTSNSFDIPESQLIAAEYPYKNAKGKIYLTGHKVVIAEGVSLAGNYVIDSIRPNATLGLIICILGRATN